MNWDAFLQRAQCDCWDNTRQHFSKDMEVTSESDWNLHVWRLLSNIWFSTNCIKSWRNVTIINLSFHFYECCAIRERVELCVCVLFQRLPAVLSRIGVIMASPLVRQVAHSIHRRAVQCCQPKNVLQHASYLACFGDLTSENIQARPVFIIVVVHTHIYIYMHVASCQRMLPPRQSQDRPWRHEPDKVFKILFFF